MSTSWSETLFPYGGPVGVAPASTLTNDLQINKNNPGVQFQGTEANAIFAEEREIAGDLWFVQNATYASANTPGQWTQVNAAAASYAFVLRASGAMQRLTAPSAAPNPIVWTTVSSVDATGTLTVGTVPFARVTGFAGPTTTPVPISQGGTGSSTQNFVDLSSAAQVKTGTFGVGPPPTNAFNQANSLIANGRVVSITRTTSAALSAGSVQLGDIAQLAMTMDWQEAQANGVSFRRTDTGAYTPLYAGGVTLMSGSYSGAGTGLTGIPWSALPYTPVQSVASGSTKTSIGGTATNPTVDVVPANFTGIPWSALPYTPVQSVTAGSTKISIGGTSANPTVDVTPANFAAGSVPNAALVTTPLDVSSTSQTKTGALTLTALTTGTNPGGVQNDTVTTLVYGRLNTITKDGGTAASQLGSVVFGNSSVMAGNLDWQESASGAFAMRRTDTGNYVPLLVGPNTAAGAYVPPVYDITGAALANTTHIVIGRGTTVGGLGTQTITLSGAAVFASASSYQVMVTPNGSTTPLEVSAYTSGSQFTVANTSGTSAIPFTFVAVGA